MKIMVDDKATRSSCLATNGQSTQFTRIGTAVPMKKESPLSAASSAVRSPSPWAWRPRETTVKERQPARPDRWRNDKQLVRRSFFFFCLPLSQSVGITTPSAVS